MGKEEIKSLLNHIRITYPVDHSQSEDYQEGFDDGVQYVIEKIEDEYDLECYEKAIKEYNENPKTYSFEEVLGELNSDEI